MPKMQSGPWRKSSPAIHPRRCGKRAAVAIGKIGPPHNIPAIPALIQALGAAPLISDEARRALSEIGTDALPAVLKLRFKDGTLSYEAINVINAMGPKAKPAIPELLKSLKTTKEGLHKELILFALERMGPEAKAAAPALRELLTMSPDAALRKSLERVLKAVEPMEK